MQLRIQGIQISLDFLTLGDLRALTAPAVRRNLTTVLLILLRRRHLQFSLRDIRAALRGQRGTKLARRLARWLCRQTASVMAGVGPEVAAAAPALPNWGRICQRLARAYHWTPRQVDAVAVSEFAWIWPENAADSPQQEHSQWQAGSYIDLCADYRKRREMTCEPTGERH